MTRPKVVFLAVLAAAFLSAGSASAQVCVVSDASCNSYFFTFTSTTSSNIFGIEGYEYGCGLSATRKASGLVRIVGNTLQIEFTGTNEQFDYTQAVNWSGNASLLTGSGPMKVQYVYLDGGILSAHGTAHTFHVTGCAAPATEPAGEAERKPDSSKAPIQ